MLEFRPLFTLVADVNDPLTINNGPYGTRRFIRVAGGTFSGERLSGIVLPGGADCQLIRPDNVAELNIRAMLQIDDGTLVLLKGLGLRCASPTVMERLAKGDAVLASEYYFRETMTFEAPEGNFAWLNQIIAVATGVRNLNSVHLHVAELL